jgi:dCTP deaminase
MILSDRTIREKIEAGEIGIDPYDPSLIQPSSIDVRLGSKFLVFRNTKRAYIDPRQPADDLMELIELGDGGGEQMYIHPGEFLLGATLETVRIPVDLVARLEGRSSLGRLGIVIHSTAGYVDPGFEGTLTLEISNLANLPIGLIPGMRIGQVSFMQMTTPAERPYGPARGSKYHGQRLPTASRLNVDLTRPDRDRNSAP